MKTHVSQIFSKLDVRDRAAAIVFAYDHGVISPGATQSPPGASPRCDLGRRRIGPVGRCGIAGSDHSPPMPQAPMLKDEDATLAAARSGDADAFEQLVAEHRPSLRAHSYRMLGSSHDAEDALKRCCVPGGDPPLRGTELGAQLASPDRDQCLPRSDRSPARRAAGGVTEVPLTDDHRPEPDLEDRVHATGPLRAARSRGLAFIAALLHLPSRPRALILRDVLGFTARDAAEVLDSSPAAVNSALQRARAAIEERNPEPSVQSTGQALESPSSPTQSSTSSRQWNGTISRRSSTACAPPRVDESLGPSGSTNSRTNRKETRMSAEPLNLRIVQFTPREIGLHERAPTDERTREVARWSLRPRVD